MVVLGISIGTRRNGIAVIKKEQLEIAQIHSLNERWSKSKIAAIVSQYDKYVRQFEVSKIIIKVPKPSHFSLALKQLLKAVDTYVKKQGCLVQYITIKDIKTAQPSIRVRRDLRTFVVDKYPVLIHEMNKDIKNRQPYYMKLFEAVVIADISIRTESE
jgi:hypothetical protein